MGINLIGEVNNITTGSSTTSIRGGTFNLRDVAFNTNNMSRQLTNITPITLITERGTNKVVTAYPSGGTPTLPNDYQFTFEVDNGVSYRSMPNL
jgi:hypothetical protein